MKKILTSAIAVLLLTGLSFAQQPKDYMQKTEKALKIGDQMPDYTFPSVIQYPKKTLNLHEFKSKVVILDFWSTFCTSCIEFFPHLQKLQDQFKDQLKVIAVNDFWGDDWGKINRTLATFKKNTGYTIKYPFALFDSTLYSYFPHKGIPYEVIIDPKGKIIAMTSAEDITSEKIQAVLEGKKVAFSVRDDFYNTNIPLISYLNKDNKDDVLVSSSLMKYKYIPGTALWGHQYNDKEQWIGERRLFSLIGAYTEAYPEVFAGAPQIKYETKDMLFDNDNSDSKSFIYDWIIQPRAYKEDLYVNALRADLDKIFSFSLRRSKAIYPCVIIRTNRNISGSYTKQGLSGEYEENVSTYKTATRNHVPVYAHNVSVEFVGDLSETFKTVKLINEANLGKQKLDIDFPEGFDFTNKEKLIAFLSTKGIDLSIENRELDCVIVSDKKPGDPTVLN